MLQPHLKATLTAVALCLSLDALAQGYQLQQFEPSAPGDAFLTVSSPWYGKTGALGVALTSDYSHQPLLGGFIGSDGAFRGRSIIDHQLAGHLDLTAGLLERVQLAASLPITLLEAGRPGFGVSPVGSPVVGDPRIGAMVRVLGEGMEAPLLLSLGGAAWIPVGVARLHSGDSGFRGLLRANATGLVGEHLRWVADVGVLLRPEASLNTVRVGPGMAGNTLRVGAGAQYAFASVPLAIGPEVVAMTLLSPSRAFTVGSSSVELTLAAKYQLTSALEGSLAVGSGVIRSAGTPDLRVIARLAWVLPDGFSAKPPHAPHRLAEEAPAEEQKDSAVAQAAEPAPASEPEEAPVAASAPASEPESPAVAAAPASEPEAPAVEPEPAPQTVVATATQPARTEVAVASAPAQKAAVFRPEELPHVYFEVESAALTGEAIQTLRQIATRLIEAPAGVYVVEGHSDHLGPTRYNDFLSLMRAETVQKFLLDQGVPADRIEVRGRGYLDPATEDRSAAGRALNRRVEFTTRAND